MTVTEEKWGRVLYSGLTPEQHEMGMDYLGTEPVGYEYSVDDLTWIRLVAPEPHHRAGFEAAIS